jgi:hypothetical protein
MAALIRKTLKIWFTLDIFSNVSQAKCKYSWAHFDLFFPLFRCWIKGENFNLQLYVFYIQMSTYLVIGVFMWVSTISKVRKVNSNHDLTYYTMGKKRMHISLTQDKRLVFDKLLHQKGITSDFIFVIFVAYNTDFFF